MKRLFISLAILAGISLSSCNDSFLEKTPVTDLTENNAFNSYDNFKAFMWPCYEMFTNNTIRTSLQGFGQDGQYKGDMAAGYFQQKYESGYNEFAYQTVASVASGNGWDFKSFIRRRIFFSFFLVYGIDRSFWRCALGGPGIAGRFSRSLWTSCG